MQKIFVIKNEDIASVVEKVLAAGDVSLVLVIPKASSLLGSLANFHLLKREADSVGKKILIESVDEQILALAKASGFEALNPFLSGPRRPVSDIVSRDVMPSGMKSERVVDTEARPRFASRFPKDASRARARAHADDGEATLAPAPREPKTVRRLRWGGRMALLFGVAGVLVLAVGLAAMVWLPRAEITVIRKKHAWNFEGKLTADTRAAGVLPADRVVPAQRFLEKRNARLSFPASGRKMVERKATGVVTIYNAYSSEPQSLVQTTRLLTPEGKLFRLAKSIAVPGARVEEGKIIPSSIEAGVIADKPGADYNIGPVSRFTIPGFKGSPKFQGFYAESKAPMAGGFVGEAALPTAEDLTKGREEIARTLRDALNGFLRGQLPNDFTVPEGGTRFNIVRETVFDEADEQGKFSIFAEAEMNLLAFRETDARTLALVLARSELGEEMEPVEFTLSFGTISANFDAGRLELPLTYRGTFAEYLDPGLFRSQAAGKSEADLRTLVAALPGFESAKISFWPFWVTHVPSNVKRINVHIE